MHQFLKNRFLRYSLYLLAVLPIFIFRDFTLDNELRYLSIADEALRNGSIFTFSNHGIAYADKPPLYLWIAMLGKWLFGYHSMLFLGMFSFLPALVIVYVMDHWVKNFLSDRERLIGELLLLTSSFFIGSAIILRMDMLMCMFIVLSLHTFFRMYSGFSKRWDEILFPLFIFMAVFSKGPIGLIVPLVSTIVFLFLKKEIRSIGKYWGLKTMAIFVTLCAIWFSGVYAEAGSGYLSNLLFDQTVNRAVNATYHTEPFYYYLIAMWYSMAPWSLLYVAILLVGIKKRLISTDLELFFLTIAFSTLAFLSILSSKLAVYMLPSIPFLVYLSVWWISKLGSQKWILILVSLPATILSLALPALMLSGYFKFSSSILVHGAALILSLSGLITLRHLATNHLNRGIITIGAGMLVAVFMASFAIPEYNNQIGFGELCAKAKTISSKKGAANYYYCKITRADNLDVYLGTIPQKLMIHDLFETSGQIKKPAILFLSDKSIERNDSLQLFIQGKIIHRMGKYNFVEIDL